MCYERVVDVTSPLVDSTTEPVHQAPPELVNLMQCLPLGLAWGLR